MFKLEAGERSELRMLLQFGTQELIEAWTRKVYYRSILQHPGTNVTTAHSLRENVWYLANDLKCSWFNVYNDGMQVEYLPHNIIGDPGNNPTTSSLDLLDYAIHTSNLSLGRELLVSKDYSANDIATIVLRQPRAIFQLQFKGKKSQKTREFLKSWLCYRHYPVDSFYSTDVLLALNTSSTLEFQDFDKLPTSASSSEMSAVTVGEWRDVVAKRLAESDNLFDVVSWITRMRKNVDTNQLPLLGRLNWKNKSELKQLLVSIYFAARDPKHFVKQHAIAEARIGKRKKVEASNSSNSANLAHLTPTSEEIIVYCTQILTSLAASSCSRDIVHLVTHYV